MKMSRTSASLLAVATLSLLAACGGGGGSGGGGFTPPGGGNGGGGGSTPTVTPTITPTVAPTQSPTQAPTQPPGTTITAEEDWGPNGDNTWYTSGVTASWTNHAGDTNSNFSGVDGMTCNHIVEGGGNYPATAYAQHGFVGIYFNGAEKALPQAIGMENPQEPVLAGHPNDNWEVEDNTCEYQMHTHDYSGLVHIADPTLPQSTTNAPSYANLQTLLDEWGATLSSATGLTAGGSSLSGVTTIYEGTPSGKDASGNDLVTTYNVVASPSAAVIGHHTAIWIVIGTPVTLPAVKFVVEN